MLTPILITNIGWGTYLLFAALNACFIPIIYFFYPETKNRSLEEIDIIFAKGFVEKMSYVRAANELPPLTNEEIQAKSAEYGFATTEKMKGGVREGEKSEEEEVSVEKV